MLILGVHLPKIRKYALQNTMMNNSEGDGFNGNMRNAKTPAHLF